MVFSSGAKLTADIVEEIATRLIATTIPGAYWSDIITVDIGATMWNTTNKAQAASPGGNAAKRALVYNNGAETPIYVSIEVINQTSGQNYYYGAPWYYGKGIRIVFSSSWDSIGHTYPTTGIQSSFIPFETHNGGISADLATTMVTYFLWVESNGFVIMGRPEPTGDSYQQSFIIVVERIDTVKKRYIDGFSNFYLYKACNIWPQFYDGDNVISIWRDRQILRPIVYMSSDGTGKNSSSMNGAGISFSPLPTYYGYKSIGNGKVYYIKPIVHNQANQLAPIFQSELFFMWNEGVGLIDGDIVAIQGQVTKFLCKAVDSPDSTNRLTYAIKYLG